MSEILSLTHHFSSLKDPRAQHRIEHKLIDIIIITICAVICGADSWVEVEQFGQAKQEWLQTFLELPNGIPSHDTIERLFARIRPESLQKCFLSWVQAIQPKISGVISIDGKTLRGATERGNRKSLIHLVSAWASDHRLVLGQRKVDEKSNEITAIPELLKVLNLEGALVTMDAMGTQKAIAAQIVEQRGDYVLALKGNHGDLYEDVVQLFEWGFRQQFQGMAVAYHETHDQGHGRMETRRCWVFGQTEFLEGAAQWAGFSSIACVEAERTLAGQTTIERRYYLASLAPDAVRVSDAVRSHWGVENQLHWVLDVAFREDKNRVSQGYSAENLAVIRHIAVNILSQDTTTKAGIHAKRLKAGWSEPYLLKLLVQAMGAG